MTPHVDVCHTGGWQASSARPDARYCCKLPCLSLPAIALAWQAHSAESDDRTCHAEGCHAAACQAHAAEPIPRLSGAAYPQAGKGKGGQRTGTAQVMGLEAPLSAIPLHVACCLLRQSAPQLVHEQIDWLPLDLFPADMVDLFIFTPEPFVIMLPDVGREMTTIGRESLVRNSRYKLVCGPIAALGAPDVHPRRQQPARTTLLRSACRDSSESCVSWSECSRCKICCQMLTVMWVPASNSS